MKNESLNTRFTLLQRLSNQYDEDSWEDFVHYYEKYIFMVCLGCGFSHHDSKEIVQLVMLKLWKKLPDFNYDKNKRFRSWLCRVTRNTALDYFRQQQRQEKYLQKAFESEHWAYYREDSLPEMEAMAEREWQNYIVNIALENLRSKISDKMVEVFLALEAGQSATDIAEDMDLPRNTVYVYQKRMQAKLSEEVRRLSADLS
ncbi:RNA polymerase sigma factor [Lentisphaera profundi]|uniref:RNA polymerase sigma factor SigS n=1 Tax=Lentisphaera profundi TaxID=1658616 RepID=A0ABY7VSF7_9BACT|nr:RNA polymerase sigma factor [Lentisphaera profundi]WDE96173.1 RNA polymerase sigma factor [Lentisphaera profundi]